MPRYEIKKGDWINANNGLVLGPVLLVGVEGSDLPATWIGLTCTRSEYERLEARLPRQQRQVWT